MRSHLLLACTTITMGSTLGAQAQDPCRAATQPIVISEDSVGPLSVHAPIGKLITICPSATPTTRYAEDAGYPAFAISVGTLSVVASQAGMQLQRDEVASFWMIQGSHALLPLGLDLGSTWAQLSSAYGHGCRTLAEGANVVVEFTRFPRLRFQLNYALPSVDDTFPRGSTAPIPDSAHIVQVWILDHGAKRC